jgi:NAD(P)-dependent dehydrogenase (short-subunit alcohol dehydrogenase family)
MGDFSEKVAVVVGGASGIGRATVEQLLREGARVAIFDRDDPQGLDLGSDRILYAKVELEDQSTIDAAVSATISRWQRIDVLVNSAGIGAVGTLPENDDAEWHRVLDINVLGTVRMIRTALPHLIAARPSSVVNLGSAVALTGFPNRALYTATKGAIVSLTRAMAADHLGDGVRFNSVCPGTTETPWIQRLLDTADDPVQERRNLEARQPHGRLVTADEVAKAIVYLASPGSGSTTGVTLSVDAGIQSLYTGN